MVFGMNKRERRVPDLSRYDYHYQNKDDFNRSPRLSAAAAYAASAGAYAPATLRSQPQRSQSMSHSTNQAVRRAAPSRGPTRVPRSGSKGNYRTYSLRSQGSAQPTSNDAAARTRNGSSSRANSITVKTTEVRDPQGRTQSITRRTVRRVNGYEYVETTTTTTQAIPIIEAEKHFDEFSGNYIIQEDDGVEEPSEEEQPSRESRSGHAYAALTEPLKSPSGELARGSKGQLPLDQTSSLSQFSDALEYIPNQSNMHNGRQRKTMRRGAAEASQKSSQQATQAMQARKPQPKRAPTEKEMYAKAYAIAQQSVYKTEETGSGVSAPQSRMAQRTLRDSASVDVGSTISSGSSTKLKSKPNRISSFFQRNGKPQHEVNEQSVPQEMEKPQIQAPKSPLPKAPVVTTKQKMSDEEMYRQALTIAQEKYGQNQKPVPTKPAPAEPPEQIHEPLEHISRPVEALEPTSRQEPVEATSSGAVQRSNSNIDERDSDVFERPEATTATKTTTPEANEGAQISEWERYDMEHPEPESKKASGERKSKIKNMFQKVKQFSIENSGYQPKGSTKAAASEPQPTEPQPTEEINIVQVAPLERHQSISSHGASTTRNVEEPLEPTNRHFDDQASETSFHRSIKKPIVAEPPQQQEPTPTEEPTPKNEPKKTKNKFFKKLFSRS